MIFNLEKITEELLYFRLNNEDGKILKDIPIGEYLRAEDWSENNSEKSKVFYQCCDELNIRPNQLRRNQFLNWLTGNENN